MIYLLLMILCLLMQLFFSMSEMSVVSINRVKLHYYLAKGSRQARRIYQMLIQPNRFFATTLIGINFFMQIGSEFARRFYLAYGLDPDLSAIMQILLVLIIAEIAPMLAARKHAEGVSFRTITPLYICSCLFSPFIYCLGRLYLVVEKFLGRDKDLSALLTKEEIKTAIQLSKSSTKEDQQTSAWMDRIFSLKSILVRDEMESLETLLFVASQTPVGEIRSLGKVRQIEQIAIYHHLKENIIGVVHPRDLVRASTGAPIDLYMKTPWFIAEESSYMSVVDDFQSRDRKEAFVLDQQGNAIGILRRNSILKDFFHPIKKSHCVIQRSFNPSVKVEKINQRFGLQLPLEQGETLEELMEATLGYPPNEGDRIQFGEIELSLEVEEFIKKRFVSVRTVR